MEMECIEARAMKSSFYSEIDMKLSQQVFFDDSWCVTGINNFSSDDFSVDDLLDFSDKDFQDGSLEESEEEGEGEEKDSLSVSSQDRTDDENSNSTTFSVAGDVDSLPSSHLPVPVDELENLEWLSQFVDDSASELSLLCPAGLCKGKTGRFPEKRSESKVKWVPGPLFPFPVPSKTRSKRSRARPSRRVWPLGSPSLTESSSTWSSSSYITSLNYPFMWTNPVEFVGTATKPPAKKQKKKSEAKTRNGWHQCQGQRRCSHCQAQKTPQWRTGPLGAKTLCNACGVRYKSGRLFPEYRPACSPTFSGDIHSNSHRKVLEMRRKKDMETAGITLEFGSTPTVSPLSAI